MPVKQLTIWIWNGLKRLKGFSAKTRQGVDVAIKFLREGQRLREGDILYEDSEKAIVVNVLETEAIVITPTSMLEM